MKKNILYIDTSREISVIFLFSGDRSFCRKNADYSKNCEFLILLIEEVLEDAKISYFDINDVVINVGPGSFIGTRVGASVAQSISIVSDAILHSVSIPQMIFFCQHDQANSLLRNSIEIAIPMRNGKYYCETFNMCNGQKISHDILAYIDSHHDASRYDGDEIENIFSDAALMQCAIKAIMKSDISDAVYIVIPIYS